MLCHWLQVVVCSYDIEDANCLCCTFGNVALSFHLFSVFNKSQVVCNTIDVEETFNAEIFSFTIVMHNDNQMC